MSTFSERLQALYLDDPQRRALTLLFAGQADQSLTVSELLHGAAGYAQALEQAGVRPGEVVIIILKHSTDLVYSFWGAALHGAIPSILPFLTEKLDADHYHRSLAALIEITAPAAVITYPEFAAELELRLERGSSLRRILRSGQAQPAEALDFANLAGLQCRAEQTVLLQHSSGTTGLQKGVALSHAAVFRQLESYAAALELTPQDVIVSWLPLYHDMGLIAGFVLPLLMGSHLVLISPFDWVRAPQVLFQAVSKYRGSLAWLPNFAYNFCAQKIRSRFLEGLDLSSWRAVINCSEPVYYRSHQLFYERFKEYGLPPAALSTCYAMAENVFAVSQAGLGRPPTVDWIDQRSLLQERRAEPSADLETALPMLSCGRPLDNVRLRVLDDARRPLPERSIGELALQSDCMLNGYYNRPDATQNAFHEGWFLTGDLGYLAGGEVYITGRKKDLIIVGGKNVYPQDLEALAGEQAGVYPGRVVAFGVPNPDLGTEEVILIAELDDSAGRSAAEVSALAEAIRNRVTRGSEIALRHVHLVEHGWLLKTSSGKIARSANREKYLREMVG